MLHPLGPSSMYGRILLLMFYTQLIVKLSYFIFFFFEWTTDFSYRDKKVTEHKEHDVLTLNLIALL